MCSQPIEHDAQLSSATPRASARSSAASAGASANVAAWKLRVGSVAMALNASRLASVPSSRYLAVAGPNERARRSRAAASTAGGSAGATFLDGRTAIALMRLEPSTAPRPPRPAWRPAWGTGPAAGPPPPGGAPVGGEGRFLPEPLARGADRGAPPRLAEALAQPCL